MASEEGSPQTKRRVSLPWNDLVLLTSSAAEQRRVKRDLDVHNG
jgi:hypothetical protein